MTLPLTQLIEVNGVKLDMLDRGSGEPIVFIHGSHGDESFAVLKEPVLTSGYRLIHYHRRGWGRSELPEPPTSISQEAADCMALLQQLGIERAHLVGQSHGGAVCIQTALDAPELVHSLSLLEPAIPSVLFESSEFGAMVEKAGSLYSSGDKVGATDVFGRGVGGSDFREALDRNLPSGSFDRWVADADTMFQSDGPALASWTFTREDAARIGQPVLNMRGVNTTSYFQEIYETLQTWLPHAENFVLPNANHCMLQLNPKGAAERLTSFFSDHRLPE